MHYRNCRCLSFSTKTSLCTSIQDVIWKVSPCVFLSAHTKYAQKEDLFNSISLHGIVKRTSKTSATDVLLSSTRTEAKKRWLYATAINQHYRIMNKIRFYHKGSKTIYKIGRRIICFRVGYRVFIGRPSDVRQKCCDALSENIAHEKCIEICEGRILAEMKYQNPVAYNAHRVLNALAKR